MWRLLVIIFCVILYGWLKDEDDFSFIDNWKRKRKRRKQEKEKQKELEKQKAEKEYQETLQRIEEKAYKDFYDRVINTNWWDTDERTKVDIRNLPRLSFDAWLTFYNSSPEKWEFSFSQFENKYCIFPKYTKKRETIFTFWETPTDLGKFKDWCENEYKTGNAAGFEQKRNKELAKLTEFLRQDIQTRAEETHKELEKLEKRAAPIDNPIENLLELQRQIKTGQFDKSKLYQIDHQLMQLSDGTYEEQCNYMYIQSPGHQIPVRHITHLNHSGQLINDEWIV